MSYKIVPIKEQPELIEQSALWFHSKWNVPISAYKESMVESLEKNAVPSWYVVLKNEEIIAGMGVIENDFHLRKDLTPNICAVYTEEHERGKGIGKELLQYVCQDMHNKGIDTLYLMTDHNSLYEKFGWTFVGMVENEGNKTFSRMYQHVYIQK